MKTKILFLTTKYFPSSNPQSILLRNILQQLAKSKEISISVFCTNKNPERIKNINFYYYNLSYSLFWRTLERLPFFCNYSFFTIKYFSIISKLRDFIMSNEISTIVSFSNPYLLNVMSYYLSTLNKIKSIINYSDPIYLTYYKKYFFFTFRYFSIKKIEKKILLNSHKIIINNYKMADYIFKNQNMKYPRKASIIPHSFNNNDFKLNYIKNNYKKNFVKFGHFGSLNKVRSPLEFLDKVIKIKNENQLTNCKFIFYGNLDMFLRKNIKKNKSLYDENNINFYDQISYFQSIKQMFLSDILISIDSFKSENIYLTSKIINYLATKKIVLNISSKGSPSSILSTRNNFINLHSFDKSEVLNKILISIKNSKKFKFNKKELNFYDSKNISMLWKKEILS